ncbi:EamA/RhaT family transporter [Autumnicola psychrophila]|uniref:EamA/RhaT family transporter n=1 Tax=Autumnicola psychrophila TaxID=3075592 RepID=A0ABU3DU88_9FLAO|nr:EamA/RhaT family transporter [Zunongwangia sp. F225]MDT0687278.1 EamA/RhaT family transporter [Zunongwangia sp. F225]
MIYLLLSILSSSVIFVVFKLYTKFGINTLQAIIVNYYIACTVGFFGYIKNFDISRVSSELWFPGTLLLGAMFIGVFYLAAVTTQKSGLSVVSVATKMSVAIPVLFGIFLYNESTGILKIIGIFLALISVYLTSIKKKDGISIEKKNLIFPLLVFFGSGIIDATIKFLETNYVAETDVGLFSSTIFAIAGIIGTCILLFQAITGGLKITFKNILGGIALGIPNFFSIYFLVMALRSPGFDSSSIFTMNNVGIVSISTLLGIVFFHEKLIKKNWVGIGLAVLSIILVSQS